MEAGAYGNVRGLRSTPELVRVGAALFSHASGSAEWRYGLIVRY